jgi:hypothetical protein
MSDLARIHHLAADSSERRAEAHDSYALFMEQHGDEAAAEEHRRFSAASRAQAAEHRQLAAAADAAPIGAADGASTGTAVGAPIGTGVGAGALVPAAPTPAGLGGPTEGMATATPPRRLWVVTPPPGGFPPPRSNHDARRDRPSARRPRLRLVGTGIVLTGLVLLAASWARGGDGGSASSTSVATQGDAIAVGPAAAPSAPAPNTTTTTTTTTTTAARPASGPVAGLVPVFALPPDPAPCRDGRCPVADPGDSERTAPDPPATHVSTGTEEAQAPPDESAPDETPTDPPSTEEIPSDETTPESTPDTTGPPPVTPSTPPLAGVPPPDTAPPDNAKPKRPPTSVAPTPPNEDLTGP